MDLRETIERIRKMASQVKNEDETKQYLILPLLEALGWDIRGPEVRPEYGVGSGRVDYALILNERVVALLEAKSAGTRIFSKFGLNLNLARQIIGYCCEAGVEFGILTNGIQWVVFKTFEPGTSISERVLLSVDLSSGEESTIEKLGWLSKDRIGQLGDLPLRGIETVGKVESVSFEFGESTVGKGFLQPAGIFKKLRDLKGKEITVTLKPKFGGKGYSGKIENPPVRISIDGNSRLIFGRSEREMLEKFLSVEFSELLSLLLSANEGFEFDVIKGEVTRKTIWISAISFRDGIKLKAVKSIDGTVEVFEAPAITGSYGMEQRYKRPIRVDDPDLGLVRLKIKITS